MTAISTEGIAGRPGDGPYIILRLKFEGCVCVEATSDSNGCLSSSLAAQTLEKLAVGRSLDQLEVVDARTIDLLVGGFQEGKGYYAQMAVDALQKCLSEVKSCS